VPNSRLHKKFFRGRP